jgi:hypothetical protein
MMVMQAVHADLDERPVALSAHAHVRCAQRGTTTDDLRQAVQHGRLLRRAGARFAFLGRQDIKDALADGVDRRAIERLEGLVVLLSEGGQVITAYWNERATADIRRKKRYDRREAHQGCAELWGEPCWDPQHREALRQV